MKLETVLYDNHENIGRIILNRPQARNAINLQVAKDLMAAAVACSNDSEIRVVTISGMGDTFCVGGDVKEFGVQMDKLPELLNEITAYLHGAVSLLSHLEVPVISGVNGFAAGAGIGLACLGDIVIAAESARFTMAYGGIGLTPDAGATYFLPRLVGLRNALDLVMTNKQISSAEAKGIGLVSQVVPDKELQANLDSLAAQMVNRATKALASTKALLYRGWDETLETQLDNERRSISNMGRTRDAEEGIKAFIEKRKAEFIGH